MHRRVDMLNQRLKQIQKLMIDPYYSPPVDQEVDYSLNSSTSYFSSKPPLNMSPLTRTPSSGKPDWRICFALCLYEYKSADPDHLSFLENEILEIVKQEDSGWWAALRDNSIGWVPSAFLQPISDNNVAALRNVREDLRSAYNVPKKLTGTTHVSHRSRFFISDSPLSQEPYTQEVEWAPVIEHEDVESQQARFIQMVSPTGLVTSKELPDEVAPIVSGLTTLSLPSHESPEVETSESESSPEIPDTLWSSKACPPSPMTPMPHPQKSPRSPESSRSQSGSNNSLPTPVSSENLPSPIILSGHSSSSPLSRSTSESRLYGRSGLPLHPNLFGNRSIRRRPIQFHGHSSQSNSSLSSSSLSSSSRSVSIDSPVSGASNDPQESSFSPDLLDRPFELHEGRSPILRRRPDKIRQLTGDDDAAAFHQAKKNQAGLPWYLRPMYGGDDIKLEYDGSVRAGTLHALIERLSVDPLKQSQEFRFRHAFLTTFHTFTTADVVFDLLVERYSTDHPQGLSIEEFEEWKEKWLRPQQKRVLTVMMMWLEEHSLLRDYPHIVPRMRDFLSLVIASDSLAAIAKDMLASMDRLITGMHSLSSSLTPSKKRRPKLHKQDLIHADPSDIAEHLALYEHKLYAKLRPQECLDWGKGHRGESVPNLCAFCGTHDKLAIWVKSSVLIHDSLGKRAEMLDTWIKIAEKCRSLNNFSSMTAIVAGLSSTVLTRLRLTWAHVARGSHLEPLQKLTEPTGNFSAFRTLYQTLDAPCVPFIGMFLTDIVHVHDQLPDMVPRQSSRSTSDVSATQNKPDEGPPLINFIKCRKWYIAVRDMLRYQNKVYNFVENAMTMNYIEQQLSQMVDKEQTYLWTRSSELQQREAAHSDIRRGLEDAGF